MAPSKAQIDEFVTFTGFIADEATAIRYIEGHNGNLELAVNDYFENPNKTFPKINNNWDERQFGADRDGGVGAGSEGIPSFQVDGGIDQGIGSVSNAPTRPPSRRSNYSNRAEAGDMQESGVLPSREHDGTGRAYFGPMTRDAASYDPSQWAMVPVNHSTGHVYEAPEPVDRQRDRDAGAPVFFKPMTRDALPSLMTILAQISGVRKILLSETVQAEAYGNDNTWWNGHDANPGQVRMADDVVQHARDVLHETQRLVAFAQESNRSYGSVESVEKLKNLQNDEVVGYLAMLGEHTAKSYTADVRFMVGWTAAAICCDGQEVEHVFQNLKTVGGGHEGAAHASSADSLFKTTVRGEDHLDEGSIEEKIQPIFKLDLASTSGGQDGTLYQQIDNLFWENDEAGDSKDSIYIEQPASILPILLQHQPSKDSKDRGLGVKVPTTFHADRYLKENVAEMKSMRRKRKSMKDEIEKIDKKKVDMNTVQHPKDPSKTVDRESLFTQTVKYLRNRDKPPLKKKPAQPKPEENGDVAMEDTRTRTKWDDIADQIEKYHANVKAQLEDLDNQRAEITQQIQDLANIFTEHDTTDSTGSSRPLQKSYSLRGIGIGPDYETTFVYVDPPSSNDAEDMTTDGKWWRIDFHSGARPISAVVTEDEVLTYTSNETQEALLVYASHDLCDPNKPENTPPQFWPSLQAFVDADNASFAAELAASEQPALPPRPGSRVSNPPDYDEAMSGSTERIENLGIEDSQEEDDNQWVPDPGPGVISDSEYVANVNYELAGTGMGAAASGRGVSTMMGTRDEVDEFGRKNGSYRHW